MLNSPVNGKIQELFKAFVCFSSSFQGKFNFQGLFKTILYIEVLFKPLRTLLTIVLKSHELFQMSSRRNNEIKPGPKIIKLFFNSHEHEICYFLNINVINESIFLLKLTASVGFICLVINFMLLWVEHESFIT